jgi:hypothetical protein
MISIINNLNYIVKDTNTPYNIQSNNMSITITTDTTQSTHEKNQSKRKTLTHKKLQIL